MNTASPVLCDFESRSRANLKAVGGRNYWAHASTEALCCAWFDTRSGDVGLWRPEQEWPHRGRVLAAHNAHGFDEHGGARCEFGAAAWLDTSAIVRRAGLPGKLEELGERWAGIPKDKAGSAFTKALSSVRKPREISADVWRGMDPDERRARGNLPELTADKLATVYRYCLSDVRILAETWERVQGWDDPDTVGSDEAAVLAADRAVNNRGIAFDSELARALLRADERQAERVVAASAKALGWTPAEVRQVAGSPEQCSGVLGTEDARKGTIAEIDHPIVAARQALATIARGKLLAGLSRVSADGRLRDTLRYYGAHTGRWSGVGLQPQNLPRPADEFEKWTDDQLCLAAEWVIEGGDADGDLIDLLLRATLCAAPGRVLVVSDFTGVEARALAFAADDRPALDVFDSGRNPYFVAASAVYGVPYESIKKGTEQYQIGKIAELALGYQGAHGAFASMAAQQGVSIDGLDVGSIVGAWRRQHAATVQFWRACQDAWQAAAEGRTAWAGPFEFCPGSYDELAVYLPSGRPVVYPEPRVAWAPGAWGKPRATLSYRGTKGLEHTYGGKIAENLIQAYCRDLMAAALVRVEADGLRPVLTCHDEIVCEVPASAAREAYDFLRATMLDVPEWASGFPAGAAGFTGKRYRK